MGELSETWRKLALDHPPFALAADLVVLERARSSFVTVASFEEYRDKCLQQEDDPTFHLGLLPQPWFGDLESATVFILMLNPGLNPGDYFAEYRVSAYRDALIANLHQVPGREFPLLFLDPEFSWHPGARYWRAKLHWLVLSLCKKGMDYRQALAIAAKRICVLQLVPYHSLVYRLPDRLLGELHSAQIARTFVRGLPDNVLVLITRKGNQWAVPKRAGVVEYQGIQSRAAHLSRSSPGGAALARHFELPAD